MFDSVIPHSTQAFSKVTGVKVARAGFTDEDEKDGTCRGRVGMGTTREIRRDWFSRS